MDNKRIRRILLSGSGFYLWIIFALNGIIAVLSWKIAIPIALVFLILLYHYYRSTRHRQKELTNYIEKLRFNIDVATKETLQNFPMPLVVLELDGTIIWYNSSFKEIFDRKDLLENTIYSIIKGFDDLYPGKNKRKSSDNWESLNIDKQIKINDVHYKVLGNLINFNEESDKEDYILLLYFIDNTELVQLKSRYEHEKVGTGIIIIDNYDELMQDIEDSLRPHMVADIDKQIMEWMSFSQGIIRKVERDRFLFVFMKEHLDAFVEKKFDILDIIKEINHGNKIPVTLSIGIGFNDKSLIDSLRDAEASIDIALGRGGDQAVIKNNGKFSFFGGKTKEPEKRTKVKARVIAYALKELINQSSNVLIMGHQNGDIDSLGSSLGVYRIARSRGKEANIILHQSNSTIDGIVSKIQKSEDYRNLFINRGEALEKLNSRTLLIVVDTYKASFTEFPEVLNKTDQVVVIDHHRKGTDFIQNTVLVYHETYASSTCELVTEILQYVDEKLKLNPLEAEALFAGIVVDTKNFTFKTGVRTFEAASFLKRQGVDTVAVKQLFQNDIQTYLYISNIVRDAEIINSNIAISICHPDVKNAQMVTAKAADELLTLKGISAAFVMGQMNSEIFISGRSLGDINVQVIMEKLGGGGHFTVAGAQIEGISIEEAKEQLKYVIIEYVKEREKES